MEPLILAEQRNLHSEKIINLLLELGADANVREEITGITPLHLAVYNARYTEPKVMIAKALIAKGANVNALDINNQTPLDYLGANDANEDSIADLNKILKKHGAKTGDELDAANR